jgi:hypothetical protein
MNNIDVVNRYDSTNVRFESATMTPKQYMT